MMSVSDDDRPARPQPVDGELYGPAEVGPMLGVKPQVVVNWIREDRIHASAVDELGRNRFTAEDVRRIRDSLGKGVRA
jgi:predicted site-specific integrase-resolvase